MVSLIKKAFVFLLHPTASRTYSILMLLVILLSIPGTVWYARQHQQIKQEAAVQSLPTATPTTQAQLQNPAAFVYIEPFTIDGIQNKNTTKLKDKNITLYLYNLTDDPFSDPKETKMFKKFTLLSEYDPESNTFSSPKFNLNNVPVGKYQLLLKVDGSLRQLLGTKNILSTSETIIIQSKEIELIMGDMNNDNEINILDYAMIMNCFEEKTVTSLCKDIDPSDLNYDSLVNSLDYDIFLKSLLVSKAKKE